MGHKGTLTATLKTSELSTISLSLGKGRKILEEREKVEEFKEWGGGEEGSRDEEGGGKVDTAGAHCTVVLASFLS